MESAIPERPKSALQIPELNFVVTSQIWKCRRLTRAVLSPCMCRAGYANGLSGVPTIRVFEALACGIPLVCSPWLDTEDLFRAGEDYVCVPDGRAMDAEIRHLLADDAARQQIANNAVEMIRRRHTCAHRAVELLEICEELGK